MVDREQSNRDSIDLERNAPPELDTVRPADLDPEREGEDTEQPDSDGEDQLPPSGRHTYAAMPKHPPRRSKSCTSSRAREEPNCDSRA